MTTDAAPHPRRSRQMTPAERAAREALLAEVATLYYVDHLSQKQIARQINRSVATISRLLAEAEAQEIVDIRVRYPIAVEPEVQEALVSRFGLRIARVARASSDLAAEPIPQLGQLGARLLTALLTDGAIVSVGRGRTMREVVRAVQRAPQRGIRVVQGLGAVGSQPPAIDNPLLTQMLSERVDGTPHFLPAPLIVESVAVRDALCRSAQSRFTLSLYGRVDVALIGIGPTGPALAGLCQDGYIEPDEMERIRNAGAVGEMMGYYFDVDGELVHTAFEERTMGMRLSDLRAARTVIGVAGGPEKALAILGVLRSGLIHVLVTDQPTAQRVLELGDQHACRGEQRDPAVAQVGLASGPTLLHQHLMQRDATRARRQA